MKKINNRRFPAFLLLAPVLLLMSLGSCRESASDIEPVSSDKTKPGVVTNIRVENFNGGAYIIYTLPTSENLLYISANYNIRDKKTRQTKASYYKDTLTVDGFAKSQDYDITLYSVSRADVKSDPIVVKIHPQTPKYSLINAGLLLSADFGGVNISGLNVFKVPVSIHVLSFNPAKNNYDEQDPIDLNVKDIRFSVRGFESKPVKFGVFTTDQYGNVSDTVFKTITPLFETLLDKSKFSVYNLASNTQIGYGWELKYFFDGNTGDPGWHTQPGANPPILGAFGLGAQAQLSRFTLWERLNGAYGYANPKRFTLWGSNNVSPQDSALPKNSEAGAVSGDWVNLGNYSFPNPPSGLPANQVNGQDLAFIAAGVSFNVSINAPPVRFIRFEVTQTWGGVDYSNLMEISFYGNPL